MIVRSTSLRLLSVLAVMGIGVYATAQPPVITINQLGGTSIASAGNLGADGAITSVSGTAGFNPGFTLFTYGDPNDAAANLTFTALSTNAASTKFWSAASATPTTSGVADGFVTTNSFSWGIIRREAGAAGVIELPVSDGSGTLLPLNNTSNLATYNTRLNAVFKFDPADFYKSSGPLVPVSSLTDGNFSFTFSDFSGGRYNGIDLVYTPVPEPMTVMGLSALGFAGLAGLRRLRRKTPIVA